MSQGLHTGEVALRQAWRPAPVSWERAIQRAYLRPVLLAASCLVVFALYVSMGLSSFQTALAGFLILSAAIVPACLWCAGRVGGLPIYPLFAVTFVWTFAWPLLGADGRILQYTPEEHLRAGLKIAGFLALGTVAWYVASRRVILNRASRQALDVKSTANLLIAGMFAHALFAFALSVGLVGLSPGVVSLVRGLLLALSSIGAFTLPFLMGRRLLGYWTTRIAIAAILLDTVLSLSGLLLIGALSTALLVVLGLILAGRRLNPGYFLLGIGSLVVLHYGKGAMREKYWTGTQQISVSHYPAMLVEWTGFAVDNLSGANEDHSGHPQTFLERSSLMHLFLLAQRAHDDGLSHLHGATYVIIPPLLLPRFLSPNKSWSHEGTFILNIHYGLQRREDTVRTTIGWGLTNEAFANFGAAGLAGLALVLGYFYGRMGRWASGTAPLSGKFLFSTLLITIAFQTELPASVVVTALFQSSIGVLIFLVALRALNAPARAVAA